MALGTPYKKTLLLASLTVITTGLIVLCTSSAGFGTDSAPTSKPSVFVLSSFEEGGPDFVKGDGEIVAEHATDGKKAYKLTNDKTKYHNLMIEDRVPLAEAKNYRWFKADVFNPQEAPVEYGMKVADPRGKFDKEGVASPGKSTLIIDLTALPRTKSSGNLDRANIRQISVYIGPGAEHSLFFDNIRYEGAADEKVPDFVLFDFENESDAAAWKAMEPANSKEPTAKVEWSTDGATSGKHALKITFDGGQFPMVTTASSPQAQWGAFASMKADVTVGRPCVVGIRVTSQRGAMDKTEFLQAGKNTIVTPLSPEWGKVPPPMGGNVTGYAIYMYAPHKGESIVVDNIRLCIPDVPAAGQPENKLAFKVLGTDMAVTGVGDLAAKLRDKWTRQESKTPDEVEAAFKSRYDEFKKTHPKAVLAIFRDGQKGFDPKNPDKAYDGWKDAHINSHGPDSNLDGRAANTGKEKGTELFMRHRSRLMQVDLATIPKGSDILAAQMVLICNRNNPTTQPLPPGQHADTVAKPGMWVAEACNRPWEEYEVNAYQYAKDKFWKGIGGMDWAGQDPDFLPVFLAHGPAQGTASWWDFTDAVKYWTDGAHENHGFFWHSGGSDNNFPDICQSPTREVHDVASRPAMMVIYDPKE